MPKITLHFTDSEFNSLLSEHPEFARVLKTQINLERRSENTKFGEACRYLHEIILDRGGPVPLSEIEFTMRSIGISKAVTYAAKKHCHVLSKIVDGKMHWYLQ